MPRAKFEKAMDEYLVKKAPFQIPQNGKKSLVEWLPWISLIFGVLALLAAWGLWQTGHRLDEAVDYVNSLSQVYGVGTVNTVQNLGITYYIALVALIIQGALMLIAFPGLKEKSKAKGWDLLLLGTVLSFVYGFFRAFTDYGSATDVIGAVIGGVVGLYLLAQIKGQYHNSKTGKK